MRKFTLLLIACFAFACASAQAPSKPLAAPDRKLGVDLENKNLLSAPPSFHLNHNTSTVGTVRDITDIAIGSSGNGLSVLNNQTNCVTADNGLKTVAFVHRNDPAEFPGTFSSQYRFDVSKDGGNTWVINSALLNPECIPGNGYNGRYPQGVLFNPSGSSNADSLYISYLGTWHNGGTEFNVWEGTSSGVGRMDTASSTFTETNQSIDNNSVGIFAGMCQSSPGTFWTITPEWGDDDAATNLDDSNYVVLKGVWNGSTRDVDWSIATIINLPPDLSYDGSTYDLTPVMAFDPSGLKGWIAITGDFINDGIYNYQPVFIGTTDGGNTWSAPIFIDLNQFEEVTSILDYDNGSGVPTTAFETNLAVDLNGNAHLACIIGSSSNDQPYAIESGLSHHIFDIIHYGDDWVAKDLARVYSFRGLVSTSGVVYTEDNRPRISRTPDGTKMFISWIETDTTLFDQDYSNSYPNMFGIGINSFLQTTEVKNITLGSNFDSRAVMPHTAPICFRNDADDASVIPTVVLEVNDNGSFESSAQFYYLQGVQFDDSEFPVGVPTVTAPSFSVSQNTPNPFSDQTQFSIVMEKQSHVVMKVTNILGQEVFSDNSNYAAGNHTYSLKKGTLSAGVYNFSVMADGQKISKKIIIE